MKYSLVGSMGLNKDLSRHDLDEKFVTDSNNVRFREGSAELFGGYDEIYATPSAVPYHIQPVFVGTTRYLLYASKQRVYVVNGSTHTSITRQTASVDVLYDADETVLWNGGVLNGIPILNNYNDVPQMWNPVATTTKLAALTAWDTDLRAKVIRPYKNYLVALFIKDTSTDPDTIYPHRVLWSNAATAGTVPDSWDITDATKDAGETDIEGEDRIVDGLTMGDNFIIYKKRSTYLMQFIGGQYIMRFQRLFSESGAMSQDCVVDLDGAHVVLGVSDLYIHSGDQVQSLLTGKMRKWLFGDMDSQYYEYSFLVKSIHTNEIWVCYPTVGSSTCDRALVWNYKDSTFAVRDLPSVRAGTNGFVESSLSYGWEAETTTWETVDKAWAVAATIPDEQRLIFASPTNSKIYLAESTQLNDGSYISASMERRGLSLGQPEIRKLIKSVRPRFSSDSVATVQISVGSSDDVYGTYTWTVPQDFVIGTDYKVDLFANGRYFAYRVTSDAALGWRFEGLDFDIDPAGSW